MTLSVIGAGWGRTGTLSLKLALERLGHGPCYHMTEAAGHPERIRDWTVAAGAAYPDWDRIFSGYRATTDWPAATYWRALAAHYPEAKVILSVRDAAGWFESTQKTIFNPAIHEHTPLPFREMGRLTIYDPLFDGRIDDRAHCIEAFERHTREVVETLPPERLLVFRAGDGWEPLCAFLGRDVPDEPFPRANDAASFVDFAKETTATPDG